MICNFLIILIMGFFSFECFDFSMQCLDRAVRRNKDSESIVLLNLCLFHLTLSHCWHFHHSSWIRKRAWLRSNSKVLLCSFNVFYYFRFLFQHCAVLARSDSEITDFSGVLSDLHQYEREENQNCRAQWGSESHLNHIFPKRFSKSE